MSKSRLRQQIEDKIETELEKQAEEVVIFKHASVGKTEMDFSREPDYTWNGKPVYRCRFCTRYERVENLLAVMEHEAGHGSVMRESSILGPDGEPLEVEIQEGE